MYLASFLFAARVCLPSSRAALPRTLTMYLASFLFAARVCLPSSRTASMRLCPMSVVVVDMIRPTVPTIIKAAPSLIRWSFSSPLSAIK